MLDDSKKNGVITQLVHRILGAEEWIRNHKMTKHSFAAIGHDQSLTLGCGNYTPTAVGVANVAAISLPQLYWIRIGNFVHCEGIVTVDPTAAGLTQFTLTLPVASNFGAITDAAGVITSATAVETGRVNADTAGDIALFTYQAVSTANHIMAFSFMYQII